MKADLRLSLLLDFVSSVLRISRTFPINFPIPDAIPLARSLASWKLLQLLGNDHWSLRLKLS